MIGLHILSPNAGEITQGFAMGVRLRLAKSQFDTLVGIHPTVAEVRCIFFFYIDLYILFHNCADKCICVHNMYDFCDTLFEDSAYLFVSHLEG